MPKFLKKLLQFSLIYIVVIGSIGLIIEFFIARNVRLKQFQLQEDWHVKHIDKIDGLFVGNSRIYQMTDIPYLEKKLGLNFYSLSMGSRGSKVLYYKLKSYLEFNKSPKFVFLQFDPFFCGMNLTQGTFNGKQSMLAYIYKDRMKANFIFHNEEGFNLLEEHVPLLRYFHAGPKGPYMLMSHLFDLKPYKHELFKDGVEIEDKKWEKTSKWEEPNKIDSLKLDLYYISKIKHLATRKKIHLILIYPPQSPNSYSRTPKGVLKDLEHYAVRNDMAYWNFNCDDFDHKMYFFNHMHLNKIGVEVYGRKLENNIRSYLYTLKK